MSEHATPGRAPEALSAEALMKKYNLPSGTNDDAIARVLARLSDLPVSGTPPPSGGLVEAASAGLTAKARPNMVTMAAETRVDLVLRVLRESSRGLL